MLVVLLAACGDDPPKLNKLPPDAVILAFGDSLTHGTGARDHQSYPAVLAERTGLEVVNAGVPGEISAKGLKRLSRELERNQPALVVICHGGNDILRKQDRAATERNLRSMIALARESGAQVVLVGVPSIGLFLDAADFYDRVAQDTGVAYEGEILSELLNDNQYKSDHVHPNAAGYARIAQAIEQLLRDEGAI